MSILIPGMEMPTSCEDCPMCHSNAEYDYAYCCVSSAETSGNKIPSGCPLIPVPEHGDLIDRDALKAKQQEDADLFIGSRVDIERRDEALNAVANIVNAPTIIPASGGTDNE